MIRRLGFAAALALTMTASALATYRGHDGTLAYRVETNDPNSGNVVDSDISSISPRSEANCADRTGE